MAALRAGEETRNRMLAMQLEIVAIRREIEKKEYTRNLKEMHNPEDY